MAKKGDMTARRPSISRFDARNIMEQTDIDTLGILLKAFFVQNSQYYLLLNEYSFNTAITLLNYATIYCVTGKLDDRIADMLVENLAVTVEPRDFAMSISAYCNYNNAKVAGIPTKILTAIRTGIFKEADFAKRLANLPNDKFALLLGYLANSKRLKEVPHSIGKPIVMEVYKRHLLPIEHLLPIIAMNIALPDEFNGIGAALLAMANSSERHIGFSVLDDGKIAMDDTNVIPFATTKS